MRKGTTFLLRIVLTVIILASLLAFISPAQIQEVFKACDWRWMGLALCLVPLFLFCRIYKWLLLEKQILGPTTMIEILPHYLWGMAVGLVTPGRVGELARVRAPLLSTGGAGYFLVEKAIEITCLFCLCLLALPVLGFIPWWASAALFLTLGLILIFWRGFMSLLLRLLSCIRGKASFERRKNGSLALANLHILSCAALSLACFLIYIGQAYFVLGSLGMMADPSIMLLFPLVLLANLMPITIGGYGVREILAVVVLSSKGIPEAVAAASVAVVTFFNLVVPGLIGVVWRVLRGAPIKQQPVDPKETPIKAIQWDSFWENRQQRPLGKLVAFFRRRFVTTKLAEYIQRNSAKGTLIEAGCGSGEVTLLVASKRGDNVVLVDKSAIALANAKQLARQYNVEARLIECDITELSAHIESAPENIVYNIGVIEHFQDPSGILREMATVSGPYAMSVVPERSVFWLTFFLFSKLLGLVPPDFFVRFFSRKQLASLVATADLKVKWLRGVRIFSLIPYIGVSFSQNRETAEEQEDRHD